MNEFNKYTLQKYNKFKHTQDLAAPLLVDSSHEYINGLENRILYIGQETNGWANFDDKNLELTVPYLEELYLYFLKDMGATNKDFWTFIEECINIKKTELHKNLIWSNTFICGKRTEIGNPIPTKDLTDLSVEYLTHLYDYFKPEYTILVNGPTNPYYNITIQFLNNIKSSIINLYPTRSNPLIIDDKNNIMWTYHPNYQNRAKIKSKIIQEINNRIVKGK